jgi:predicted RNase H-like HicB family nuclease
VHWSEKPTARSPGTGVDSDHETGATLIITAIIEGEDDVFVALCPEFDIASQGASIEEARTNLIEALTLFFETAAPSEVARRFRNEVFVTQVEVPVG